MSFIFDAIFVFSFVCVLMLLLASYFKLYWMLVEMKEYNKKSLEKLNSIVVFCAQMKVKSMCEDESDSSEYQEVVTKCNMCGYQITRSKIPLFCPNCNKRINNIYQNR